MTYSADPSGTRLPLLLLALSCVPLATACTDEGGSSDDPSAGSTSSGTTANTAEATTSTTTGGGTGTDTDTDTTTGGDTDTDSDTGDDDPLAACLALPAAAAANWEPGGPVEAQAESTPARMQAAGDQTWDLALTLLELTDATAFPSVAAAPASMSVGLGMTYGRYEAEECGDRILSTMAFAETGDALHNTLGAAAAELESRSLPAATENDGTVLEDPVVVSLRSSVWAVEDVAPPNGTQAYGAELHDVIDGDLAAINDVVNCVIEEQSQGLLPDFIPENLPSTDTTSFEVNVAFLQAPWGQAMAEGEPFDFTRDDGSVVSVDAFDGELVSARAVEAETFIAADIPMRGGDLRAMFVMPSTDVSLAEFVASLELADLQAARDDSASVILDVEIPNVDIASSTIDFYDALQFECPPYKLRTVLHGAAVQIDEVGIKAAAAAVGENFGSSSGGSTADASYRFDRPFLFFIYDTDTNFVLYSGRYAGPA